MPRTQIRCTLQPNFQWHKVFLFHLCMYMLFESSTQRLRVRCTYGFLLKSTVWFIKWQTKWQWRCCCFFHFARRKISMQIQKFNKWIINNWRERERNPCRSIGFSLILAAINTRFRVWIWEMAMYLKSSRKKINNKILMGTD